jgi:hypothetical protein
MSWADWKAKWLPRIAEYECMPMQLGWLGWGLIESNRNWPTEYYYLVRLLLPSWRFEESFLSYEPEWQRLALMWHGKHGFALRWLPERWL